MLGEKNLGKLLGCSGKAFAQCLCPCFGRTGSKAEQSRGGMHLAQIVPSWEQRDQGTGAAGKVTQRRRQQVLCASAECLIPEQGCNEVFIIAGYFMEGLVIICLSTSYLPCVVYYIDSEHRAIYIYILYIFYEGGFILNTLTKTKYQHSPNKS